MITLTGWWFGCHVSFFHMLGTRIPTGFFQRGWSHQPVMDFISSSHCRPTFNMNYSTDVHHRIPIDIFPIRSPWIITVLHMIIGPLDWPLDRHQNHYPMHESSRFINHHGSSENHHESPNNHHESPENHQELPEKTQWITRKPSGITRKNTVNHQKIIMNHQKSTMNHQKNIRNSMNHQKTIRNYQKITIESPENHNESPKNHQELPEKNTMNHQKAIRNHQKIIMNLEEFPAPHWRICCCGASPRAPRTAPSRAPSTASCAGSAPRPWRSGRRRRGQARCRWGGALDRWSPKE